MATALLVLVSPYRAGAQILFENPSFEGYPQAAYPPPQWFNCGGYSTPDTQPGNWGVTTAPKDGNSYLGMVCRPDGTYESVYQPLSKPLLPGNTYRFTVHLAHSQEYDGRNESAILRVWGSDANCSRTELLWSSPEVYHLDWQAYEVTVTPALSHSTLMMEAYYASDVPHSGHIMLDHIVGVCEVPPASITLGPDTLLCPGQTITKDFSHLGVPVRWSNGSTASHFTIDKPGQYWAELRLSCQVVRVSVGVQYGDVPRVELGPDQVWCDQRPVRLRATWPGAKYRWSNGSADSVITVTSSGTYWAEASTFCGVVRDTVKITFEPPPVVELGADTIMCVGQTLYLNAFHPQGQHYFWQGFPAKAAYEVTTDGTYQVEVRGRNCSAQDAIRVRFNECESELLIPNVFTPDGDGINDRFEVRGIVPRKWRLQVYNRYGQAVFGSMGYNNDWDGAHLPAGVYFYSLQDRDTPRRYKGWVHLLR